MDDQKRNATFERIRQLREATPGRSWKKCASDAGVSNKDYQKYIQPLVDAYTKARNPKASPEPTEPSKETRAVAADAQEVRQASSPAADTTHVGAAGNGGTPPSEPASKVPRGQATGDPADAVAKPRQSEPAAPQRESNAAAPAAVGAAQPVVARAPRFVRPHRFVTTRRVLKPISRLAQARQAPLWLVGVVVLCALVARPPKVFADGATACQGCPIHPDPNVPPSQFKDDSFEHLIQMACAIPTKRLRAFPQLMRHLEACRECYIDGQVTGEPTYSPTQVLRDADLLIHAIYLRSLSKRSLSRRLQLNELSLGSVHDPRVRALIRTMAATEQMQQAEDPIGTPGDSAAEVAQRELKIALKEFPNCFYAEAALAACEMSPIKRCIHAGIEISDDDKALISQRTKTLCDSIPGFVNCVGPRPALDPAFDGAAALPKLAGLDKWQTLALLIAYNNWLDFECLRISALKPPITEAQAVIIGKNIDDLTRQARANDLPPVVILTLGVTGLEYLFLADTVGDGFQWDQPPSEFKNKLFDVLKTLDHDPGFLGSGSLDGEDSASLMSYLRSGSPFLRRAWTDQAFDALLRQARKQE